MKTAYNERLIVRQLCTDGILFAHKISGTEIYLECDDKEFIKQLKFGEVYDVEFYLFSCQTDFNVWETIAKLDLATKVEFPDL